MMSDESKDLKQRTKLSGLIQETNELTAMLTASVKTVKKRR